jgi:hypothetical protein
LIIDTDSDCATDDSENGEKASDPATDVIDEPLSSSATWGPQAQHGKRGVNNYSGEAVGLYTNEAPHVNKDSTPFCVFMLYFAGIIRMLVEETNKYYHQHLDRQHAGSCCKGYTSPSEVHRSTSCCVIGDISIRGGHSTSLADCL